MSNIFFTSMGFILAMSFCLIPASVNAQSKKSAKVIYFDEEDVCFGGSFNAVSPNGNFVVGHSEDFSGSAFIWSRQTGEISLLNGGAYEDNAMANAVSDDGTVAGNFKDENSPAANGGYPTTVPGYWKDGQWYKLPRVKNIPDKGSDMNGMAMAISADGRFICGYIPQSTSDTRMVEVIWKDGELQPVSTEKLYNVGNTAYSFAVEGKIICGAALHDDGSRSPAVWIDGEMTRIAGEKSATEISEETGEDVGFFDGVARCVSENGEYVAGYFDETGTGYASNAFVWTQNNGIEYFTEGMATVVTSDKTVYGSTSYMGEAYIYKDGITTNLEEYLKSEYNFEPDANYTPMSTPLGVSADGKVIAGWGVEVISDMGVTMKPMIILLEEEESSIGSVDTDQVSLVSNVISNDLQINGDYTAAQIYNSVGALVTNDTRMNGSIDLVNLDNGIYFVKVSNGIQTQSFKVIKK